MHIVGLTYDRPANAEYRVELPLRALAREGHETATFACGPEEVPRLVDRLRRADVVHVWRLHQPPVRRAMRALREAGVAIVWDNDDEMVRLPPGKARRGRYEVAREQLSQELTETMRLADAVTTTSAELARRFRGMGAANVSVIDNYVGVESLRRPRSAPGRVVVGWVAGNEHRADLKQLRIRQALEQVLARHEHVEAMSLGLDLGVRSERYRRYPAVTFATLPDAIAQIDIGLAPIADLSFNRGRSRVKLKEYAAAGVPWLASPIGPYRGLGEEQGGRLVPDPLWRQRLEELILDEPGRLALSRAAATWAETQTVVAQVQRWEEVFGAAVERACARSGRPLPTAKRARVEPGPARRAPAAPAPTGDAVPRRGSVLGRLARLGRSAG